MPHKYWVDAFKYSATHGGSAAVAASAAAAATTTTPSLPAPPPPVQAVIILLGWWGAQPRHLRKYAQQLYQSSPTENKNRDDKDDDSSSQSHSQSPPHSQPLPSHNNKLHCLTIQGIADPLTLLFKHNASLDVYASQLIQKTAALVRDIEAAQQHKSSNNNNNNYKIPILIHGFSNGGTFTMERMELQMMAAAAAAAAQADPQEKATSNYNNDHSHHRNDNSDMHDALLVRDRMVGQLYDSAPAYPSLAQGQKALRSAFSSSPALVQTFLSWILSAAVHVSDAWWWHGGPSFFDHTTKKKDGTTTTTQQGNPAMQAWHHARTSRFCLHQAYIYSTADEITRSDKLDELIAERRDFAADIRVLKFTNSGHVDHWRQHPAPYQEFVTQFVKDMMARSSLAAERVAADAANGKEQENDREPRPTL